MGALDININKDKGVVLLTFKGSIDFSALDDLKKVVDSCKRDNNFKLVMDFKNVDYINSRGVGALLETAKDFRDKGGDVKLISISKKVSKVFALIGLNKVIKEYNSYSDAVLSFSGNGQKQEFMDILYAFRERLAGFKVFLPEILDSTIEKFIGKTEGYINEEEFSLVPDEFEKIINSLSDFKADILNKAQGSKICCPVCDISIEEKGRKACYKCGELLLIEDRSVSLINQRKIRVFRLYMPSEETFLGSIRTLSSNLASDVGMQTDNIENIEMAVDEVCSNIIEHAHGKDGSQKIELDFILDSERMKIIIIDQCQDKEKINSAVARYNENKEEFKEQIEGRKSSGMGVRLIKNFMDEVEYIPGTPVGNVLRMTKKI
jgi:anti-anti-sigma factor